MEQMTCLGCERSTYAYDACRGCGGTVCFTCWEAGLCQCGALPLTGVPMDAVSRAERWLVCLLEWHPTRVTYLQDCARRYGVAWMSVRRAKARLPIKVFKKNNHWIWELGHVYRGEHIDDEHLDDHIPGAGDWGQF